MSDGSYYRTTVTIDNSGKTSSNCLLRLYGWTIGGSDVLDYGTLEPGGYVVASSAGKTQPLQSGYATLACSSNVEVQLTYSHYSPDGTKISEATVVDSLSVPPPLRYLFHIQQVQVLVDRREGARFALAIANDSDQIATYYMGGELTLNPHTHVIWFLDNLACDFYGPVWIAGAAGSGPPNVIGLRYTGETFTTIPATIP